MQLFADPDSKSAASKQESCSRRTHMAKQMNLFYDHILSPRRAAGT